MVSFLASLFLITVQTASSPASLPVPGIRDSLGRESRQAVRRVTAYHESDDGACRLPIPAGFRVKARLVKGGPVYDAAANHIIRRPDRRFHDLYDGLRPIAVVEQLRGAVFPRGNTAPESALRRVASDYLRNEVLEDGRYFPATPNQVSTSNGISRVSTLLENGYGENKFLNYCVEYVRPETDPVLVLTVQERQAGASTTYHGLVAKCFADTIVMGYARFLLKENLDQTEAQTVLGAIAGIQVKDLAPNPELEKSLIGTWEPGRSADDRYIFGPDGRFARTEYAQGDLLGQRRTCEPGDYRVFGNLISLRYDKDEQVSFPVRVEGNVLNLGNQAYARVK